MITTIFMHADGVDILLMTLGFLGAVGDGASFPVMLIAIAKLMNIIGGLNTSNVLNFRHNINENVMLLIYVACAKWIACFLESSSGIMSMNYSTQGLKDTSHLKTVPLIGFMWNYGHEQFNSTTSWVTSDSPMIRNTIPKGIRNSIPKT
uniref:Uncharacterized protein n=1 Tax=Solanum tuberosum TaxID=4113 RepID=M1DI40_SOLTU